MEIPRLGWRGQGWVWGQFLLAAVVVVTAAAGPRWAWPGSTWIGGALLILGAALGWWSLRTLGASLSPFPKPRSRAELVEHGPYRIVRHPIYSSALLALLGLCLVGSWWGLVALTVLLVWWLGKAHVEEHWLRAHYPGYEAYCHRVRARIIPWLL
ncbi:MAG: isoprenylcysteine carboxylmethyltransferase family protein [Candidatus Nanopelagicales bacterium]